MTKAEYDEFINFTLHLTAHCDSIQKQCKTAPKIMEANVQILAHISKIDTFLGRLRSMSLAREQESILPEELWYDTCKHIMLLHDMLHLPHIDHSSLDLSVEQYNYILQLTELLFDSKHIIYK